MPSVEEIRSGQYLALLGDGDVVDDDWRETLARLLDAKPEAAAVGGRLLGESGDDLGYLAIDPANCTIHFCGDGSDDLREVAVLPRPMMVRASAVEQLGSLEYSLFSSGYVDVDFCARAVRNGWRLYQTGACAAQVAPGLRNRFQHGRDRVLFAHRHMPQQLLLAWQQRQKRTGMLAAARGLLSASPNEEAVAWRWARDNTDLLRSQRSSTKGVAYDEAVRSIQRRAHYYNYARPEIMALVPEDARHVVDVGCASGALGHALKRARPGVEVRGIEPVGEQAERARSRLDDVLNGGADDPLPSTWPQPDCVIFADVLEHLTDPWSVLRRWRRELKPGGALVVSIPNVAHHSVVTDLLRGRWDYQDAGILDRTHLRFFTRKTATQLLTDTGFEVVEFGRVTQAGNWMARQAGAWAKSVPNGAGVSGFGANLMTVQFLMVGR